jgi:hypothetical protein
MPYHSAEIAAFPVAMAQITIDMGNDASTAWTSKPDGAARLEGRDNEIDELAAQLPEMVTSRTPKSAGRHPAHPDQPLL